MFAQLNPAPGVPAVTRLANTVLVVDDEEGICETLRDVFEDEGFNVRTVNNGRDALRVLQDLPTKPCVVILDLIMPILDGNAVYAAMKADPELAGIQVVISTSDPSRAPEGSVVMRKPIALDALLALVRRCC
jgi:two-component system, sensor histidine kinase and response regulator